MVCSERKLELGTCFDSRRELSADEIEVKGLEALDYQPSVVHDFDHDGLADSVSFTQATLIYGQLDYANGREQYNLSPLEPFTLDVFLRSDASTAGSRFALRPATIAVHDVTGDGQADLIVREEERTGNFRYFIYENQNPFKALPAYEGPTLHALRATDDKGERASELLTNRQFEPNIEQDAVIDLLGFHPGTLGLIHYYQFNDGPFLGVHAGDPIVLHRSFRYRYPLSVEDNFTVRLFNEEGDVVQSFTVEQDIEDHVEWYRLESGPAFAIYHVPGREPQLRFDDNTAAMVAPVLDQLDGLTALWGSVMVDGTVQKVVFIDDEHSSLHGTGDQLEYNTVFIVPIPDDHETNALVVLHEAAHNVELTWLRDRNGGVLQEVWQELIDSDSMAFQLLNERYFLRLGKGGHSQDSAYELFATLTVDLLQGPEALESALSRWDASHSPRQQRLLRRDLRKLFDAYQGVLNEQAPHSKDFLRPYYRVL